MWHGAGRWARKGWHPSCRDQLVVLTPEADDRGVWLIEQGDWRLEPSMPGSASARGLVFWCGPGWGPLATITPSDNLVPADGLAWTSDWPTPHRIIGQRLMPMPPASAGNRSKPAPAAQLGDRREVETAQATARVALRTLNGGSLEDVIRVRGARQHNLRNVDLTIPRNRLVVFTGVSGSGKSSLAFDTIFAEGQRR